MKRLLLLILIAGLFLPASRAHAQDGVLLNLRPAPASVAALFLENPPPLVHREVAETCSTPGGCMVLGTVLTVTGLGVSALGIAFLTRLDSDDEDIVRVPVIFLGGALLATGLISTGVGIHLIARGRRLKRMNLDVGWQGAPAVRLYIRI